MQLRQNETALRLLILIDSQPIIELAYRSCCWNAMQISPEILIRFFKMVRIRSLDRSGRERGARQRMARFRLRSAILFWELRE